MSGNFPVNLAASATVTLTAVATVASVVAFSAATTTINLVALGILAAFVTAISIASMSAYFDPTSTTVEAYFSNVKKHTMATIPIVFQFIAQIFVKSAIEGVSDGMRDRVGRKVGGH